MALPNQELIALLTDLESDRVERKESAANSDRLSEAIRGFANDMSGYGEPGVLFVGVSDGGVALGRPITDELLRRLADLRDQGTILPPPTMTVRKLRVDGGEVAVVEVQPSVAPPVRFKGRVYIRVGPRRAIASLDEERRLNERRRSLDLPFDSRPILGASLTDLDEYAFTSVLLPALLPHESPIPLLGGPFRAGNGGWLSADVVSSLIGLRSCLSRALGAALWAVQCCFEHAGQIRLIPR